MATSWDSAASARLDAAAAVDAALQELGKRLDEYNSAVAASAEAAAELPNTNLAEARSRLRDTKVDGLVVGALAGRFPHLATAPGGVRSQHDADAALLSELARHR